MYSEYLYQYWPQFSISYPILLLFLYGFHDQKKNNLSKRLLESLQLSLAFYATFNILVTLFYIFESWYTGYIYEQMAFYNRALGDWFYLSLSLQFLVLALPLLFMLPKLRFNKIITLIIFLEYVLSFFGISIIDYPIYLYTSYHRDYLPASWSTSPWLPDFFSLSYNLSIHIGVLNLIFIIIKE
jgi:hypothetical protein